MTNFAGFTKSVILGVSALALTACVSLDTKNIGTISSNSSKKPAETAAPNSKSKMPFGLFGKRLSKSDKLNNRLGAHSGTMSGEGLDPVAKAAFWGTRYDREPHNADVAASFSASLRAISSEEEALRVMEQANRRHEDHAGVQLEYGKALIANDRAFEAVRPIEKAIAVSNQRNWVAYSTYGVALDKIGEHRAAQAQYDLALSISQNNSVILNNKGLSYALDGKLKLAEATLRQAARGNRGTSQTRQNLALVLGFSGQTSEAERLARSDLPPRMADNNVDYFRSLFSQPAYWQDLDTANTDIPSFEPPTTKAPVETYPLDTYEPLPQAPTYIQPESEPEKIIEEEERGNSVLSQNGADFIRQPVPGFSEYNTPTTNATGAPVSLETTSYKDD